MNIFWMETVEGAKIPLLMVKHPLSIDNINTSGMTIGDNRSDFKNTAPPELTQEWFEATNDELWRFMTDLSIGNVLYENGRELTFKEKGPYNSPMKVGISPQGERIIDENYRSYVWEADSSVQPWGSRLSFYFDMSDWFARLTIDSTVYGVLSRYGKPEETEYASSSPVVVLIRDTTGRVKPVVFNVYNNMYLAKEEYNFKVVVKSTPNMGTFYFSSYWPSDEFWQAQKGAEPEKPKGGGIVDITDRFSPRTASSSLGIYPITKEQLTNFSFDMWTVDFLEKFIMNLYGKPIDSLISLRWYYGILGDIKRAEKDTYLTMGNVAFKGGFAGMAGTEIITKPAISEYITFSCGEILVERYFNNFLDMTPFTKLQVFLPYIGFVSLDATEFMGKYMRLDYNINLVTGAAVAYIYVRVSENNWRIVMQIPCAVGIDIPISFDARESISSRMISMAMGVASVGLGAVTGLGAGRAAAGAAGALAGVFGSMAQNVMDNTFNPPPAQDYQVSRSAGMDSETGSLGYLHPFLLISRPKPEAPSDYNELVGSPDFRSGKFGTFQGYVKVGSIKNTNTNNANGVIPRQAMNEIEQLLRGGVYTE